MTEHTITPVTNPAEQVRYWIAQGMAANTSMTEAEAQKSAQELLRQYDRKYLSEVLAGPSQDPREF